MSNNDVQIDCKDGTDFASLSARPL